MARADAAYQWVFPNDFEGGFADHASLLRMAPSEHARVIYSQHLINGMPPVYAFPMLRVDYPY